MTWKSVLSYFLQKSSCKDTQLKYCKLLTIAIIDTRQTRHLTEDDKFK